MRTRGRAHVLAEHAPELLQAALEAALNRLATRG
jgi:hypothetical protein